MDILLLASNVSETSLNLTINIILKTIDGSYCLSLVYDFKFHKGTD